MEPKYLKLVELLKEDGKIEEIFCGTAEDILNKLANYGIELTMDEPNAVKDGFNEEMAASEELTEEALDDVAGGCQDCSAHGRETGKTIAKWLRKIKNFICFWNW